MIMYSPAHPATAFILINAAIGNESEVLENLKTIEEV